MKKSQSGALIRRRLTMTTNDIPTDGLPPPATPVGYLHRAGIARRTRRDAGPTPETRVLRPSPAFRRGTIRRSLRRTPPWSLKFPPRPLAGVGLFTEP